MRHARPFPTTLNFTIGQSTDLSTGIWTDLPFWLDPLTSSVIQDLGTAEIIEYRYELPMPESESLFLRMRYAAP